MTTSTTTAVAPACTPAHASAPAPQPEHTLPPAKPKWQRFVVQALLVSLAAVIVATINRNWNAWEGGRIEQVTDDAYVCGVSDYQSVHKVKKTHPQALSPLSVA